MSEKNAGFHNQALMEFGALQCVHQNRRIVILALLVKLVMQQKQVGRTNSRLKSKKIKQRIAISTIIIIESKNFILLEKRKNKDIWKNLYQFPLLESKKNLSETEIFNLHINSVLLKTK